MSWRLSLLVFSMLATLACESIGSGSRERVEPEVQDRLSRSHEADHRRDRATVHEYRAWQDRIRVLDLVAVGLPPIDDTDRHDTDDDDAPFRPVTRDLDFCARLPAQETPAPALLVAAYRSHGRSYGDALFPESFEDYRAHYLAERHMARLACLARAAGPAHVAAFLGLLEDDSPWVRYTASVHAINHDMDAGAAMRALEGLSDTRAGYAAALALTREQNPLGLAFDPNGELDIALSRLRGGRKTIRGPRTGTRF